MHKIFRMVITKLLRATAGVYSIGNIELYGHKENDLIRFPDATNVRKYPDTVMSGSDYRGGTRRVQAVNYVDGRYPVYGFMVFNDLTGINSLLQTYSASTGDHVRYYLD